MRRQLVINQQFTNVNVINITHNANTEYVSARVIIDGIDRIDIVSNVSPDSNDPKNSCVVTLDGNYTGTVQIFNDGFASANILPLSTSSATSKAFLSRSNGIVNTTLPTNNTDTRITFGTVQFEDIIYDYNSNGVITIERGGIYLVYYSVSLESTGSNSRTGSEVFLLLESDDTVIPGSVGHAYHRTSAVDRDSVSKEVLINVGECYTFSVAARRYSGGATLRTISNSCNIIIRPIG